MTPTERRDCDLEVDDSLAPFLAWVAHQPSGFSSAAAQTAHPGLDAATVQEALEALRLAEYLDAA